MCRLIHHIDWVAMTATVARGGTLNAKAKTGRKPSDLLLFK